MDLREQLSVTVTPPAAGLLWTLVTIRNLSTTVTVETVMYCTYDLLTVHAEISYVVNLSEDQQYFYSSIRTRRADVYSCCMHVRVCSTVRFYLLYHYCECLKLFKKRNGMKNNCHL